MNDRNIHDIVSPYAWYEVMSGEREGPHSSHHWWHVAQLGILLANLNKRDPAVPLIFALYHDCRRENDDIDPGHGPRAAALFQEHFDKGWLNITLSQMTSIKLAIHNHTNSKYLTDEDAQVCLDADRLTLPRVGTQTCLDFLHTTHAKTLAASVCDMYECEPPTVESYKVT